MASITMMSAEGFRAWTADYGSLHIDLGTGDGTYALHLARAKPDMAVIGIDTCLDNLTKAARKDLPNLRFLSCDATEPPAWLDGAATGVSVNFPFGSLLRALTAGDDEAHRRLFAVARPGASVDIRVNGSAARQLDTPLDVVRERLSRIEAGSVLVTVEPHDAFRRFPSEWAKRLAYGRPSDVVVATARIGT